MNDGAGARFFRGVLWFHRGVFFFKVATWTLFALVGPAVALWMSNFVGGAVMGGISVLIGAALFRDGVWSFQGRKSLRIFLCLQGLAAGAYSAYRLVAPPPGWQHENEASRPTLVLEASTGTVHGVEFGGGSEALTRDPAGGVWTRRAFPGRFALTIALDAASGATLIGEDRRPTLWLAHPRDPASTGEPWRALAMPGEVLSIARTKTSFLVATRGPFTRLDATSWQATRVPEIDAATTVCAAGNRVLVVRSGLRERAGLAWESFDGGTTFHDELSFRGAGRLCALDGAGWAWVAEGGLFSGELAVRAPGGDFVAKDPPLPRMESLVVNGADGREAWVGGWGGGVFRSRDGGASWQSFGLDGFEVESIAVDFARHVVFASTGSGVYSRSFRP